MLTRVGSYGSQDHIPSGLHAAWRELLGHRTVHAAPPIAIALVLVAAAGALAATTYSGWLRIVLVATATVPALLLLFSGFLFPSRPRRLVWSNIVGAYRGSFRPPDELDVSMMRQLGWPSLVPQPADSENWRSRCWATDFSDGSATTVVCEHHLASDSGRRIHVIMVVPGAGSDVDDMWEEFDVYRQLRREGWEHADAIGRVRRLATRSSAQVQVGTERIPVPVIRLGQQWSYGLHRWGKEVLVVGSGPLIGLTLDQAS